jgi:Transposase DDE domain group 1
LLDAEADRLYERTQGRQDTRAGSYERSLHTVSSPPIAPVAARRSPTRSVSCSIRALIGLMLTMRDAIPKKLATAEFATLRLRLLKIAARVVETTSRIRLAFAAACPEADLFRSLLGALLPLGP